MSVLSVGRVAAASSLLVAVLAACSSSSSSGSSSGGNGSFKTCPSSGSSSDKCTQAEKDEFAACPTTKCDAEFKECFGSDYKNGNFTGVCADYMKCVQACACNDTACVTACKPSADCQTCTKKTGECQVKNCPTPACYTSGSSTSGTCADLQACCNKMTGADKDQCTSTYDSIKGSGDAVCGAALTGYKSKCN